VAAALASSGQQDPPLGHWPFMGKWRQAELERWVESACQAPWVPLWQ